MSPGPIGELEDKAIETVSKMAWFRNITFGQVCILIGMFSAIASAAYGLPWAVDQIKAYGTAQESAHRAEREASEKRFTELASDSHAKGLEKDRLFNATIEKQWGKVEEKDKVIQDLIRRVGKPVAEFGNFQRDTISKADAGPPGTNP